MLQKYCGTEINYTVEGQGKDIILLHGWGQNIEMMEPLGDFLKQWFRVWNIDLPGFAGKSPEPPFAWDIYDYATMLADFISRNEIKSPTLMGHSLGGRISIIYAARHIDVHKVVLLDSAGILPKRSLDYYWKVYSYKAGKSVFKIPGVAKLFPKKMENAGSVDYQNATPLMRQVLSKVVNEDLTYLLKDINAPTLLVWGELDDQTPLSDAKIMEKEIPNAGLVVFPNAGHYAYLECLPQLKHVLESFFSNEINKVI